VTTELAVGLKPSAMGCEARLREGQALLRAGVWGNLVPPRSVSPAPHALLRPTERDQGV